MKIHTITGRSYVVSSAAGATVTTPTGVVLLTVTPGSQGAFVAPGGEVDITDNAALCTLASGAVLTSAPALGGESLGIDSLYEHKENADIHVTLEEKQAWSDHIADDSAHISDDERMVWNAKPSEESVRDIAAEVADAAVSQEGIVSLCIGGGDDKINAVSIELDASYAPEAQVSSIAIRCRDDGELSSEPVFLGAFEQVSGDSYKLIAVSDNAITQQLGEWSDWSFSALALSGKRMRYAALAAPDTPFSDASTLYLRCTARSEGDSTLIHTSSRPYSYVPEMVIRHVGRVARFAPSDHLADTSVHLSEREREMLNTLHENPPHDGADGTPGESAFDIWKRVNDLPEATEEDFLASLKGEQGEQGERGEKGAQGEKGEPGEKGEGGSASMDEDAVKHIVRSVLFSEESSSIGDSSATFVGELISHFSWNASHVSGGQLKAIDLRLALPYEGEPVRLVVFDKDFANFELLALSLPARVGSDTITFPFSGDTHISVHDALHCAILRKWDAEALKSIAGYVYASGGVGYGSFAADLLGEVQAKVQSSSAYNDNLGNPREDIEGASFILALGAIRYFGTLQL